MWLGQQITAMGRAELQDSAPGVPVAELVIMGVLMKRSPSSITELATNTGYAQSRVSTAVSSAVARGWATIGPDPADGRRTLVYIPEESLASAVDYSEAAKGRAMDRLLSNVPERRRKAVAAALEELLTAFRQDD
jgi:DNA-binding MarR family transcriptional regulator